MQIIENEKNKKLKQDISNLKEELSILVNEYELLINTVCKNIEAQYFTIIGKYQLEKLYLEFEAKKLKRKIELIQSYVNQNKSVNITEVENILLRESLDWEREIRNYATALKNAEKRIKLLETEPDSTQLKSLFRKLCKILHPDINPNLNEMQKLLWTRVYEAYKDCNLDELKAIELILDNDEDYKITEVQNDLSEIKNKLDKSIKYYIEKINDVKSKKPYILINIIENENLINSEKEKTEIEKLQLESIIIYYKNVLKTLGYENNVGFSCN